MKYYKAKTEEDIDYIVGLFNPDNTEFMNISKANKKAFSNPNRNDFILTVEDKKIGWFNIFSNNNEFGMIIDKPYQGKGYGGLALQYIEQEAKNMGIEELKLVVNVENIPAVNIYMKDGFEKTGTLIKMSKKI